MSDGGTVNSSSLWYTITELETGEPYFVRVSAKNSRGLGLPRGSNPAYLAPPKQVPATPEGVYIFPASSRSLRYGIIPFNTSMISIGCEIQEVP